MVNGKERVVQQWTYDENAQLIREVKNIGGEDIQITYNNGSLTRVKRRGVTLWDTSQ